MLGAHQFDPHYNPDKDDSPILCVGADYQGPPRPTEVVGIKHGAPWVIFSEAEGKPWINAELQTLKIKSWT